MDDTVSMTIVNSRYNLREHPSRFFFLHSAVFHEMVENLTASSMLCHEVYRVLRLHHLIKTRDVRMVKQLQDGNFTKRLSEVVIVEACFVDDFDGNLEITMRKQIFEFKMLTTCVVAKEKQH